MWFLLHCEGKSEAEVMKSCEEVCARNHLLHAFVLTGDHMRKYEGAWHLESRNIFPGSVILECETAQTLVQMEDVLRDRIGRTVEITLTPVNSETEQYLKELCGETHHLPMSRGVIHEGKTCIMEGPLQGWEDRITRIDRHKRLAFLKFSDTANGSDVKAGLEITEKTL